MWIKEGAAKPTPEHFDEHYAKSLDDRPAEDRLDLILDLLGSIDGLRILDLGGGTLLGRACKKADKYVCVDFSQEACLIGKRAAPWGNYRCMDVVNFLRKNVLGSEDDRPIVLTESFDVTVAVGIVDYLPAHGLDLLFSKCPSPALVFVNSVKESYLQYPARITIPSREDVEAVSEKLSWKITKEIPNSGDHLWARFERRL